MSGESSQLDFKPIKMFDRKTVSKKTEDDLFSSLLDKFLPFWPHLLILLVVSFFLAWSYVKFATPQYEINAKLIIKDEKKGVDDSQIMQSMNPFDSKKIVENEIQVIQSRDVLYGAVDSLNLYAPIYQEKFLGSVSAYTTSPIKIKVQRPDRITVPKEEYTKYFFTYEDRLEVVLMEGATHQLNQWIDLPFGKIMFIKNDGQQMGGEKKLYFELVNPMLVVDAISDNLEVGSFDKLSTVVTLVYTDAVRERGVDILNHIFYSYSNQENEARKKLAENTLGYIEDRIEKVETELSTLQNEVQQYRSAKGAVDLSEQGRLYLQDAGENDRKIASINQQLSVLNRVESYIMSGNVQGGSVASTAGIDDPILTGLLNKLYDSEIKYARLQKTTGENNPLLVSLDNEIAKIRPSILENIKNQQSNLSAGLLNLGSNSGRLNSVLKSLPEKERALLEIKRRETIKNNLFSFLLQKREETALAYAPSEGDSKMIEKATADVKPVSPNGIKSYGIALFLALGLWVAFVVLKEALNNKILFRNEIEKLTHLPVLGEISQNEKTGESEFLVSENRMLMDQFRQIEVKLGLYSRTFEKLRLLITSNIEGEGKSFISKNLAFSLAKSGKRVALLDMDFRRPQITRSFDMLDETGIVDFLGGKCSLEAIFRPHPEENGVVVLPSGTYGGDFNELLLNGNLESLFEGLSTAFDCIIIDSAPIGMVSDTNLLAEYADIKLLVIRHAVTPKTVIKRFGNNQPAELLDNMGVVFNGIRRRGFSKESGGYGYGYNQAYEYVNTI